MADIEKLKIIVEEAHKAQIRLRELYVGQIEFTAENYNILSNSLYNIKNIANNTIWELKKSKRIKENKNEKRL
jgi:hypothetical protein